jgi:D-alanyl-D-alanine carboxypeptidase
VPEPQPATVPLVVEAPAPVEQEIADLVDEVPAFDRSLYSLDEPSSLWVIVNKARAFDPIDYIPEDLVVPNVPSRFSPLLRAEAAVAVAEMFEQAESEGMGFVIQSTYRSYVIQRRLKRESVERYGQEVSDGRSARAGHSEHQSGLAVDFTTRSGTCTLQECFAQTPEGEWLYQNSWKFGFVLRYTQGATPITGYIYEPWHFRYVGRELAEEIWNQGYPTLEEFFGLGPAPDYLD